MAALETLSTTRTTRSAQRSRRALAAWAAAAGALLLAACSDRSGDTPDPSELTVAECSDGRDNDADGLVDCAEPACAVHGFCDGAATDGGTIGRDAGPAIDAGPWPSCVDPIDVVFVIDVSTSMADELDNIRAGIGSIWRAAEDLTASTQFSLVVFVDAVEAVNGCAPFATVDDLEAEFERWRAFCSSNRQPGPSGGNNGDCAENSIDALHAAATTCPWRDGATHVLVHVTDDTFAERPANLGGTLGLPGFGLIPVQHTYGEVMTALVEGEIRVGAFAAPGAGEFCGAGTSADVGRGFHAGFAGNPSLPEATGGRAFDIREVRAGTLDMAETITSLIRAEHCTLF